MSELRTLADLFHVWNGAKPAPVMTDARGGVDATLSSAEVTVRVAGLVRGLESLGIGKGDRGCASGQQPARMAHRRLRPSPRRRGHVSIYTTLLATQVAFILKDAGASRWWSRMPTSSPRSSRFAATCPNSGTSCWWTASRPPVSGVSPTW